MRKILPLFFTLLLFAFACNVPLNHNTNEFKKNNPDLSKGFMTPEILWSLGRIGEFDLSPDNSMVVFRLTYYSIEQNKSNSQLYVLNLKDTSLNKITSDNSPKASPVWRPDGKKIAFLRADENSIFQIFEINPDGSGLSKVTHNNADVSNFIYSPDLKHILFTTDVKVGQELSDKYPDLPNADAKIYNDLMFRHWDTWEDSSFSHIFVANYDVNMQKVDSATDIMKNEPYDSPMHPFDGIENINWSNDGSKIVYTCKKLVGMAYAISTNSDIYMYDLKSQKTTDLSTFNKGYDKNAVFSHNDKFIAWESMKNDGYESDKDRLVIYNLSSNQVDYISDSIDQNLTQLSWNKDDSKIYFISPSLGTNQIFTIDIQSHKLQQISSEEFDYTGYKIADNFLIASRMSMKYPVDLCKINLSDNKITQITNVNKDIYEHLRLPIIKKFWVTTTDKKKELTWVIYPPDFDSTKKYPALLYCEGGPQEMVSQFFSYRWNFHIMAANGYIIVAPNRRGLPGFGQEWNAQISKDYGGQNAKDLLSAIDSIKKLPYVDANRLGAVGASYGGYSIYWLAGNSEGRFKALIAHDGIFDFTSMYTSTEEIFFANWDYGGSYWNPTSPNSYGGSPHLFIKNWNTPIMIVQGGTDYRVPETQAFEAFTAARLMGVPAKLLYFPHENHWVLKPQNGILWQREFFAWLDKYLK